LVKKYFFGNLGLMELLKIIVIGFGAIIIGVFMHHIDLVNIIIILVLFLMPLLLLGVVKKEEMIYILKSKVKES